MQNAVSAMSPTRQYRERLTPSLGIMAIPLLLIPMVGLVSLKDSPTLALPLGVLAAALCIAVMYFASPVIEVSGGELRAGRAHIPLSLLGESVASTNDEARAARGRDLNARAWHVIRGGIDGIVTVKVTDPADPTPVWVVSSRTPDRLAAAISAAQS